MRGQSSVILQRQLFLAQYTAVMLIVLTFVVGAFTGPKSKPVPPPPLHTGTGNLPKIENPVKPIAQSFFGTMQIESVYNAGTNTLDVAQLDGVRAALSSHDIGVSLQIKSTDSSALVARMVSTHRWLESLGIPETAYQVEGAVEEKEFPQLAVSFFKASLE